MASDLGALKAVSKEAPASEGQTQQFHNASQVCSFLRLGATLHVRCLGAWHGISKDWGFGNVCQLAREAPRSGKKAGGEDGRTIGPATCMYIEPIMIRSERVECDMM